VRQRNRRVRGCGRVGNLDERKTALAADVLHFAVADGSQIGFSTRLSLLPRAIIPVVASVRKQVRAKPRRGLTEEFSVRIRTYPGEQQRSTSSAFSLPLSASLSGPSLKSIPSHD